MRIHAIKSLYLLFLLNALATSAYADSAEEAENLELQQRQAFETQFPLIMESLSLGSVDLFANSIDKSDFLKRIFGLRLIEPSVKKSFTESMQTQFVGFVSHNFDESKGDIRPHILGIESRGDRARALVRFDLPKLQFTYQDFDLRLDDKGGVVIIDWIDYLHGQSFTDATGTSLVQQAPTLRASRKLLNMQYVSDADLFQFTELLKAGRDRQTDRYTQIYQGLNPAIQKERVVVLQHVAISRAVNNRRFLRQSLIEVDKYFPDEPLFSIMLLDLYVPTKQYDTAFAALQRTYDEFGFEDAAMEARLSAITLAMGNSADAAAYAERAVLIEPGLELGWWSALRARAAIADYPGSVEALQQLEENHGHTLGAEELQRDKSFAALLESAEFKSWAASR